MKLYAFHLMPWPNIVPDVREKYGSSWVVYPNSEYDPVLGLMLVDADHVIRLTAGTPRELKLVDTIDGRLGRPDPRGVHAHEARSDDAAAGLMLCDGLPDRMAGGEIPHRQFRSRRMRPVPHFLRANHDERDGGQHDQREAARHHGGSEQRPGRDRVATHPRGQAGRHEQHAEQDGQRNHQSVSEMACHASVGWSPLRSDGSRIAVPLA